MEKKYDITKIIEEYGDDDFGFTAEDDAIAWMFEEI